MRTIIVGILVAIAACGDDKPPVTQDDATIGDAGVPDGATPDATEPDAGSTVTAPPLDPDLPTSFADATSFLYTDPGAIQIGVTPGAIDPKRVVVLRGRVTDRANAPLAGVRVAILVHPEFGYTLTRSDGMFDMAANGGGPLTVHYTEAAHLLAQRQVTTSVLDYVNLPDVIMVDRDATKTTITMGAATMQVARGSMQSDASGDRRATVLFPAGTTGSLVQPDGSTVPAASLDVRLTEYTVGPNGPAAMPGSLPATTGYTYAVELGVDQAVAKVNGRDVVFDRTVYFYVENFLNFPVGEVVPVGFYDPAKSAWVGSPNGTVIKLLTAAGDLDVTGDNIADTGATLTALGITTAERSQIASMYTAGQTLWRTPLDHFSTIDCNWSVICTGDCTPPKEPPPPPSCSGQSTSSGSIIGCERQTLGEEVELPGTTMSLTYQSDRVAGRTAEADFALSLRSAGIPMGVVGTEIEVLVAGQKITQSVSPMTQTATATWNGLDPYNRPVVGSQPFTVRVGYRYKVVYARGIPVRLSWAALSGVPLVGNPARMDVTLYQEWHGIIRRWSNRGQGLGGWSLDAVHSYDPIAHVLHLGDGTERDTTALGAVTIGTFAGGSIAGPNGDGGPATAARLSQPQAVAIAADGAVFIAENGSLRVRKVAIDGTISTVAGSTFGNSGDGGPATSAQFRSVTDIAVGPDGSLYIADSGSYLVRRVAPDGIIHPFAGNGAITFSGDTGQATAAGMEPYGLAVGLDGSVYIADRQNSRVRVVDQNGIINTFAGTTSSGPSGDGGPATTAKLSGPTAVAIGPDGSVFIMDRSNIRVRKVSPQGIMSTVAGDGTYGSTGDGGPATSAKIAGPNHIAVTPDGTLYIADYGNERVRAVGSDGIISTIAGDGVHAFAGDGGLAPKGSFAGPDGIATSADGTLYVTDFFNNRVRVLRSALPGSVANETLVPSTDADEIYIFNSAGRHLRTLDGLTGALRMSVVYGASGIASLDDGDGNITTIERDASGSPTGIASPHGFHTTLATDARGYLSTITAPSGAAVALVTSPSGLLTKLTDRRGGVHDFMYDTGGRLVRDADAAGAVSTLTRTANAIGSTVTLTTMLGHATTYLHERLASGDERHVTTGPDGAATLGVRGKTASITVTHPDGTVDVTLAGPDPRYGMLAPILASFVRTTPAGLVRTYTATRTSTLATPGNPLDIATLTDAVTVNGRTWTRVYTKATNTIVMTSPAGRTVTATLDVRGRVATSQNSGEAMFTYGYDASGRPIAKSSGPRSASYTYGANGFADTWTDELGAVTTYAYDADGRVTSITKPDGATTTRTTMLAFTPNGLLASLQPPGRMAHAMMYDGDDLGAMYLPPGGLGNTTIARDSDRRITRVTLPDASMIDVGYDGLDRFASATIPRGSIALAYDAQNRVSSMTAPGGIVEAYAYDGLLPMTNALSGPIPGSVTRAYDTSLRASSLTVNGAGATSLAYDLDDRIVGAGTMTITRHAQTRRITGSTLGVATDAWTYNTFGEPLTYVASTSGTPRLSNTYVRDAGGRIMQRTETILGTTRVYTYTYDRARRLLGVADGGTPIESYTYDANGARLTTGARAATFDAQDRLVADGTTTYAYTNAGFLSSKSAGSTTSYAYDQLGYLVGVTIPGTTIVYLVDGRGNRVGKRVNGTLVQGFLYENPLRPIAELDGSGAVVARFVYGTRENVPDYMIKAGATYRIVADDLGSPRLVIDSATGAIAQRIDYDAFGNVTADSSPGFQPFGFGGGIYDRDTKLVQFGARDYDAATGRWTTKDPLLFAAGDSNLYAYVGNDPVNHRDPSGLQDADGGTRPTFYEPKETKATIPLEWLAQQQQPQPDWVPQQSNEFTKPQPPPTAACAPTLSGFKESQLKRYGFEMGYKFLSTQNKDVASDWQKSVDAINDKNGAHFIRKTFTFGNP